MRMPEPENLTKQPPDMDQSPAIQRSSPNQEKKLHWQPKEEEEKFQAKTTQGDLLNVLAELDGRISALQGGGGQPLPPAEQAFFEPRFGADFSGVQIHTDPHATEVAHALNARAFTVGRNAVIGSGHYQPQTPDDRQLLAHELTHVIQQTTDIDNAGNKDTCHDTLTKITRYLEI
jgi:hypothetical protein